MSSRGNLTAAQKTRIAKNRQKALNLKAERKRKKEIELSESKKSCLDTELEQDNVTTNEGEDTIPEDFFDDEDDIPTTDPSLRVCEECSRRFLESFLLDNFNAEICDRCRDSSEKHRLISRTEAKETYLLKDHDFDKREPIMKYILKKNPRNEMWGDMKLYLEIQVAERAMLVWGSEEAMEEEKTKRLENREKAKHKKYAKKMKALRFEVRTSLGLKQAAAHEHEYDEETYDEEEDMYSKSCKTCNHKMTYEKM